MNTLALRLLAGKKKRLHELAFPANRHPRQPLVPVTLRHLRLGVEPLRQELQLGRRNLPALDAVEEMLEQRGRDVLPADLRHSGF